MRLRHAILWVLPLGIFFSGPLMAGSPEEVFQQVAASIVVIEVSSTKGEAISLGSGVIIAPGQIITNCHVIKDGKSFTIRQGNQTQPASLRYQDIDRDLCQLEATGFKDMAATMTTGKLKTGQRVYAIGTPQGLELTISEGLISSLRDVDGAQYIQTTAAISPGSSGGGLFDDNGHLIGITTFYFAEGQNLNFALPAAWIAELPKRAVAPAAKPATDSPMVWLNKAVALEEKQDWPGLLSHSRKWVKASPGDAVAWLSLGIAYRNLKQTDKAIEAYHEALRINPEYANAWVKLGVTYADLNQPDKAIDAYREALRINPGYADASYLLGMTYGEIKQTDKAIEAFRDALRINPEDAQGWYHLGNAYSRSGNNDKAIESLREAIRINPQDVDSWLSIGFSYFAVSKSYYAIKQFDKAAKPLDKSTEAFVEVLRMDPQNVHAWRNLCTNYSLLKQDNKAVDACLETLRIDPQQAAAWFSLGGVYNREGRRDKVHEIYQTLRKLDPELADRYFNIFILP